MEVARSVGGEKTSHIVFHPRTAWQNGLNMKYKFHSKVENNTKQPLNQEPGSSPNIDDPFKALKIRFAKGEITKEQYEEMRKMLE